MTEHCSVLLTQAKTQMSSPVRGKEVERGRGVINKMFGKKGETILNQCSGLCSSFFKPVFCFDIF